MGHLPALSAVEGIGHAVILNMFLSREEKDRLFNRYPITYLQNIE